MTTRIRKRLRIPIFLILVSGCSAPVNVEPFAPMMRQLAEVTMALSAVAISMETHQTAGRDINDPWVGRLAMSGGTIIVTIVLYMAGVRPLRSAFVRRIRKAGSQSA